MPDIQVWETCPKNVVPILGGEVVVGDTLILNTNDQKWKGYVITSIEPYEPLNGAPTFLLRTEVEGRRYGCRACIDSALMILERSVCESNVC